MEMYVGLSVNVFADGRADSARTGHQLGKVADDLVGQTAFVQVYREDGGIGQDGTQLFCIDGAAQLHAGEVRLHGLEQRVRAARESSAVVVHADEVAQPACQHQRDERELGSLVIGRSDIGLDGFTEADGQLLRGIGRDALRCIRHERVGEAHGEHLVQELLRVDNARVNNERHTLLMAHAGDELHEILVPHLSGDGIIAEDAAVHGQTGVQRIEAGADLHLLDLVHHIAAGDDDTGLLERRTAVREAVLDDEVLRLLGVDERRRERMLCGFEQADVLQTVRKQLLFHARIGARRDLIDHAPRERNVVLEVSVLLGGDAAVIAPRGGDLHDGLLQLFAVVGAVIHRNQRERRTAGAETLEAHRGQLRHEALALLGAVCHVGSDGGHKLVLGIAERVALFGNGKGYHLEAGLAEHLGNLIAVVQHGQALGHRADDLLVDAAVRVERHAHGQVVVGTEAAGDDLIVIALAAHDAGVHPAFFDQTLAQRCREDAEDVA